MTIAHRLADHIARRLTAGLSREEKLVYVDDKTQEAIEALEDDDTPHWAQASPACTAVPTK